MNNNTNGQQSLFPSTNQTAVKPVKLRKTPVVLESGAVKGCSLIYAPKGQAGEYAKLACNPYRGCGHKCTYCVSPDTLVLMADGRGVAIKNVRIGDQIIGVKRDGRNGAWSNRYVITTVEAKIKTRKPAYKITMANGTEIVCSGDHRWLTDRGWKYTVGDMSGDGRRPYLTTNNEIRGFGYMSETPDETEKYMLGYLSGMIRGDAHLAIHDYSDRKRPSGKTMGVQYHFRLALIDEEGVSRTERYLENFGISVNRFDFNNGDGSPMTGIRNHTIAAYEAITEMIKPQSSKEWYRGWLAGIFDSEGSYSEGSLRVSNMDIEILDVTCDAFRALGFRVNRENYNKNKASMIRLYGGFAEAARFFQETSPAIKRKFTNGVDGRAVRSDEIKIKSIDNLGEITNMYDITTGAETFIANGFVSHNCYVPLVLKMKRPEFDAGAVPRFSYVDDTGVQRTRFIEKLRRDAAKYHAAGITEQVMLSFTTDPYNIDDVKYGLTRQCIQVIQEYGLSVVALTKGGSRALRDIDLFRPGIDSFATTLTSLDDEVSLQWEGGAALPADRIETLRRFHERGISTWVSLEPVFDTEATKQIIRETHEFVGLYKVGKINYHKLGKTIDWQLFTDEVVELMDSVGAKYYIKKDLRPYLR